MKLGISSYTYGWAVGVKGSEPPNPLDEHGLIDKALECGLSLLQIGDNLPLHTFDSARLTRLADRAAAEGVELEVGARGLTLERIQEYAAIARRVESRLIRFVIDDSHYHPEREAVSAILRAAAPKLDGLTIGIENHDRFSAKTLRAIIENSHSALIGVCLDTANSLGAGEGIEVVAETLGPLTVNLHIKDFQVERLPHMMGFSVAGRPAGAGFLKVPELIHKIDAFGRCKSAVLELWTPPESRIEETLIKEASWAGQSLAYLKPFFT
jgi:sugar phosphate isomerase/epimerase